MGCAVRRTPEGKISQRNFGGHEYPRLATLATAPPGDDPNAAAAHRGPAAGGQEGDRRLRVGASGVRECTVTDISCPGRARTARCAECSPTGAPWPVRRIRDECGHHRDGASSLVERDVELVGVHRRRTRSSAAHGGSLINMECIQFHPTGMVWPLSVKGLLVTESVRGDGGVLTNSDGVRFMFNYVPEVFRSKYASTIEEPIVGTPIPTTTSARRSCCLATRSHARSLRGQAGRGSPHGGVFLDVSSRLPQMSSARNFVDVAPVQGARRRRHHD